MRKIFFVFVALLWIISGIQLIQNLNKEDEGQIVQAFNNTNCMDAVSKVQATGRIMDGYKTKEEQTKLLEQIAHELGITGSYEVTVEKEENRTTVKLYRGAAQAETMLRVVSIEDEISENMIETTQYLLLEISLYDKFECAVLYKDNLDQIMRELGMSVDISLQFSGELPGKVVKEGRDALVDGLLESISAKVQQKYEHSSVYTVYAYTDLVNEYQKVSGKDVNVTIAVAYDEEKDRTKLYLATPFIREDY